MNLLNDTYQYTKQAFSFVGNISARIIHNALLGFTTIALPGFSQLVENTESHITIHQNPAVLPLPFTSREYNSPWHVLGASSTHNDIQAFDPRASKLLDNNSHILLLVEHHDNYAFAHEAPVYFPDTDTVYFCSDAGGPQGRSNSTTNNVFFQMKLNETISRAREGKASFEEDIHPVPIHSDAIQMVNGATPYQDQLLLINSGRTAAYPPSLAILDRSNPSRVMTLLNNAAGKQFNALNDVKVNFHTGSIYFTDASYGQSQNFRPAVDLPKATWRFDPISSRLTMLDASVITPNGLALSGDGRTLYITETASNPGGEYKVEPSIASVIYAFDIIYKHNTEYLQNRRLFAYVPTGVADGIQVDTFGNVYSCTGDGLYVWDPNGVLLMRAFIPDGGCVSLYFTGKGQIIITAQARLYLLQFAPYVNGPALDTYPRIDKRITLAFPPS